MKHLLLTSALLTASLSSWSVESDEPQKDNLFDKHGLGISVNSISIDEQAAKSSFVDKDMYGISLFWQGEVSNYLFGLGLGTLTMDDNASYNVDVIDLSGREDTRKAKADAMFFFMESGYRYQIEKVNMDLLAGYEHIRAERSVANCTDCPEETLDIDASFYFKPRIGYQVAERFWIDLSYTVYTGGDVENNIGLEFTLKN